jgi:hypothetical protein
LDNYLSLNDLNKKIQTNQKIELAQLLEKHIFSSAVQKEWFLKNITFKSILQKVFHIQNWNDSHVSMKNLTTENLYSAFLKKYAELVSKEKSILEPNGFSSDPLVDITSKDVIFKNLGLRSTQDRNCFEWLKSLGFLDQLKKENQLENKFLFNQFASINALEERGKNLDKYFRAIKTYISEMKKPNSTPHSLFYSKLEAKISGNEVRDSTQTAPQGEKEKNNQKIFESVLEKLPISKANRTIILNKESSYFFKVLEDISLYDFLIDQGTEGSKKIFNTKYQNAGT